MSERMECESFKLFPATKKKMEEARRKLSKTLNYDNVVTWDVFFNVLMNMYISEIDNSLDKKFDLMREELVKVDNIKSEINTLRSELKECFKHQNNQSEELLGIAVKQKNSGTEILQKLQSIETQNENVNLAIKSLQEFNASMNDNLRTLIENIKTLLANISTISDKLSDKVSLKLKKQFGIAVPILLHYMVKYKNFLAKEISKTDNTNEAIKEINKIGGNYKNLYNSSEQYSDGDIEALLDKYSMKEQLKGGKNA